MQRKDKENMIFKKVFEQLNNVGTEVMNWEKAVSQSIVHIFVFLSF
jgi:hypothetical protein